MISRDLFSCAMRRLGSLLQSLALGLAVVVAAPLSAQDALERAESIKQWRSDCSDPDADVRFAYVEAAIASADPVVQRTCLRLALDDNDVEIRRLAVQLALVSSERLVLRFEPSEELVRALEEVKSRRDDVEEVWDRFGSTADVLHRVEGVLTLEPLEVTLTDQVSRWLVLLPKGTTNDSYTLAMTLVGDRLTGLGSMHDGSRARSIALTLELADGGALEGRIAFDGGFEFPATARLY